MAKKSMPVYFTEDQFAELKKLRENHYAHMSFYAMMVDICMKEAKRRNK